MATFVQIKILNRGSTRLRGFKDFEFSRNFDSLCGQFSFDFSERDPNNFLSSDETPRLGDRIRCDFMENSTSHLICHAFVESISVTTSKSDHRVSFSGREITCDIVDSDFSRVRTFRNTRLSSIVRSSVSRFSLSVQDDSRDSSLIDEAKPRSNENIFSFLNRTCRRRSVFLNTTPEGKIRLFKVPANFSGNIITLNEDNVLKGRSSFGNSKRYFEYSASKTSFDYGDLLGSDSPSIVSSRVARDLNVDRPRFKKIIVSNKATPEEIQLRANKAAAEALAMSESVSISLVGWTFGSIGAKRLWELNSFVNLRYPIIGANSNFLVKGLRFSIGDSGTITTLSLVRPQSFNSLSTIPRFEAGA